MCSSEMVYTHGNDGDYNMVSSVGADRIYIKRPTGHHARRNGKRTKRERETTEYLSAARRFLLGAGRRCADADEVELAQLIALADVHKEAVQTAVDGMRARGMSWAYIASATGTSREAAYQKWGKH